MSNITPVTLLLNSYFPEPHASLINGILVGQDLSKGYVFYDEVKRVGLLHLVVLSGVNISLLGSMVRVVCKPFGHKFAAMITIVIIVLFVAFVGADPPVTRAAIMGGISLLGVYVGRRTYALYVLFLSVVAVAICKPEWLTSVSFQLSTGATLGIILFAHITERDSTTFVQTAKQYLWSELKPSLAAQVFTAPIIMWNFKEISLIAPFSNIAVSFTVAPIMLCGFLTIFLGFLHHSLGLAPAIMCYGLLEWAVQAIHVMSRIPGMYLTFH